MPQVIITISNVSNLFQQTPVLSFLSFRVTIVLYWVYMVRLALGVYSSFFIRAQLGYIYCYGQLAYWHSK